MTEKRVIKQDKQTEWVKETISAWNQKGYERKEGRICGGIIERKKEWVNEMKDERINKIKEEWQKIERMNEWDREKQWINYKRGGGRHE